MKFNNIDDYLNGKTFSNGLKIAFIQTDKILNDRINTIENITNNSKVIHVGFADHIPLIKNKIEKNNWLHKRLINSTKVCVGIDINKEAVEFVKRELDISNVYHHDIIKDNPLQEIMNNNWDYLILGEVLEHVDNPVLFLSTIKQKYGSVVKRIVITVPNAFDLINLILIRKNIEFINTDHRYWFTPYTLAKVGRQSGLMPVDFYYCQSYLPQKFWQKFLVKRFPMVRESILMVFEL